MKKNLVSVVIPTYNREKLIINTINSVLRQTYQKFEIIVIDDGSKDNTEKVVKSLNDERIKYFYQENAGAQVARNNGLKHAQGKFISFLDCADEWLPEFIEKCVTTLDDSDYDCVYCLTGVDGLNGDIVAARIDTLEGDIYSEALKQGYITSPLSLMIKTSCFETIGGWDENLKACQDDDICFRLAKHFKFKLIPEVLVYVNGKDGTGISSNPLRVARGWEILWDKYKDEIIKECGADVLAKHYYNTAKLYANINLFKDCCRVCSKVMRCHFSWQPILLIMNFVIGLVKRFLFKKQKNGNQRKITILGFIKFSYKKRSKNK